MGHGAKFLCPITQLQHHLSAILYIDDTNLLHINLTKHESINEVHLAIQESVYSWGNLLMQQGEPSSQQNVSSQSFPSSGRMATGATSQTLQNKNWESQSLFQAVEGPPSTINQ
jgi:hypothetical protein